MGAVRWDDTTVWLGVLSADGWFAVTPNPYALIDLDPDDAEAVPEWVLAERLVGWAWINVTVPDCDYHAVVGIVTDPELPPQLVLDDPYTVYIHEREWTEDRRARVAAWAQRLAAKATPPPHPPPDL